MVQESPAAMANIRIANFNQKGSEGLTHGFKLVGCVVGDYGKESQGP